jgi:hypothetical protein
MRERRALRGDGRSVRRPTSIRLGSTRIPVTYHAEVFTISDDGYGIRRHRDFATMPEGECADLGLSVFVDRPRILVSERSPDHGETLLHEIMHHMVRRSGLTSNLRDGCEEQTVRMLSTGIIDLLRDNRGLCEYLSRR